MFYTTFTLHHQLSLELVHYYYIMAINKGLYTTDVSYISNFIKLVVFNLSLDTDSPPDVMVETFSMSVTDK